MTASAKKTVSELMQMAVEFRRAPAQDYDKYYKTLQNALYQLIEPVAVNQGAGWIGVDLDGTLVVYPPDNQTMIGRPVPAMVSRIQLWLERGVEVRIFTARASQPDQVALIKALCLELFGVELAVVDRKDYMMIELWDDRAVRVVANTGRRCCDGGS